MTRALRSATAARATSARFGRAVFLAAGIYGLVVLLPLYLSKPMGSGRERLYFYGFVGAAAATQLLYLIIATDVRRFRPTIPVGVASKLSFAMPSLLLVARGALPPSSIVFAAIDLVLAAAFLAIWWISRGEPR